MQINLLNSKINDNEVKPTQNDLDYSELIKFKLMIQNGRDLKEIANEVIAIAESDLVSSEVKEKLTRVAQMIAVVAVEKFHTSKQCVKIFDEVLPRIFADPKTYERTVEALGETRVTNEML